MKGQALPVRDGRASGDAGQIHVSGSGAARSDGGLRGSHAFVYRVLVAQCQSASALAKILARPIMVYVY